MPSYDAPERGELARTAAVAAASVAVAWVAFYGLDVATGRALFFTHDFRLSDLWHMNVPWKHFYAQELRAGRLPLWAPGMGTGYPLLAGAEVGALYPPHLLLFGLLPLPLAFNAALWLHGVWAGAGAAAYARELGAPRAASAVAGLVFALSGFFVTHEKHPALVATAAWTPWLLLLVERHARAPSFGVLAGVAGVIAAMVLAGHFQIAHHALLLAAAVALYHAVRSGLRAHRAGRGLRHALAGGGVLLYAAGIGLLLGAPQILPTAELSALGPRASGLSVEEATHWDLQWRHLLTFVLPHAFGDPGALEAVPARHPVTGAPLRNPATGEPVLALEGFESDPAHPTFFWEITAYLGVLPLVLAAAAVALGARRREVRFLLVLVLVSVLLALGRNGGLFHLLHALPIGFDRFRFLSRFLVFADLGLAVLAAIGLGLVLERLGHRVQGGLATGVVVAVGIVCWTDLDLALGDHNPTIEAERWLRPPPIAVRMQERESEPFRYVVAGESGAVFRNAYYRARGWKGDLSPYDPARTALDPNLNLLYGLESALFYAPLYPRWMVEASSLVFLAGGSADPAAGRLNAGWTSLLNVRYVIDPGVLGPASPFPLIETYPGDVWLQLPWIVERSPYEIGLRENPAAMPRAFLVPGARSVVDEPAPPPRATRAMRAVLSPDFDPRREVLLMRSPDEAEAPPSPPGPAIEGGVELAHRDPQRLVLRVEAPRDAWLFLGDTWYPGWRATLDGVETRIHRANLFGRAVRVPAGRHEVVFAYRPASFRSGLGLAALGLLLLAPLPWLARRARGE